MAAETLHRKRVLSHGVNAAVVSLAVLGSLVVGFILVDRYKPFRKDLTRSGMYSLASKTKDMLGRLDAETSIVYFELSPSEGGEGAEIVNRNVKDLLDEFRVRSKSKITFEVSNPLVDAERMVSMGADPGSAVFKRGEKTIVVQSKEIAREDMMGEGAPTFTGEEAFDAALIQLSEGKARTACFLSGHGEPSIESEQKEGYRLAAEMLRRENLDSKAVTLTAAESASPDKPLKKLSLDAPAPANDAKPAVPGDCTVLIVAGPTGAISAGEADAIVEYWKNGGGVIVLAEPFTHSGIEALTARFGVDGLAGVAADNKRKLRDPLNPVPVYGKHEIVDSLEAEEEPVLFVRAIGLKASAKPPEGVTVTKILETSPDSAELVAIKDGSAEFDDPRNIKGPIGLGFAVEKQGDTGDAGAAKKPMRAVILGDSDFAGNAAMQQMAVRGAPGNIDLFKNSVAWAAGAKEKIGISPKTPEHHPVTVTGGEVLGIFLGTGFALPGSIFGFGLFVWIRRRHR